MLKQNTSISKLIFPNSRTTKTINRKEGTKSRPLPFSTSTRITVEPEVAGRIADSPIN